MPAIPAHLAATFEVEETAKASVQQILDSTPAVLQNSEDAADVSKPDEGQIQTAEFKASPANVGSNKPSNFQQVGPDQRYVVKVFA